MLEIHLEDGTTVPLRGKSVLIIPPSNNRQIKFVNKEDDYDVIMIYGGIARTVNIEIQQTTIIIVQDGMKTVVNVTGGMEVAISQAVFIGGDRNTVNGLSKQNRGQIMSSGSSPLDLGALTALDKIDINRFL